MGFARAQPILRTTDLRDVAIKGRGLALLPEFIAADALRKGELRTVLDDYSAPPLALYAVYPPTRHLSVKVRLFIDFLVERFGREEEVR
jgi:DNA-binding transcriptional LysR family regulator